MTVAILFFVLVGVVIGGGIGYGVGHVDGMREGRAERVDRQLDAAIRKAAIAGQQCRGEGVWPVGEAWDPPLDWRPPSRLFDFEESEGKR